MKSAKSTKVNMAPFLEAEGAAVFIADESQRPYDVDLILADLKVYRSCYRAARRLMPATPALERQLAAAKESLDIWHELGGTVR